MAAQGDLSKLVSLTFDESPKIRIEAAESLGKLDDPAALFALVDLSYDKEPEVRKKAQEILDKKKKTEEEVMSFAEIFSRGKKKEKEKEKEKEKKKQESLSKKEKIMSPINNLFEKRLGKEKAEKVRLKMMPTIEKLYKKSGNRGRINEEHGKEVIQEFLTNYLEAVSGVNGDSETAIPQEQIEPEASVSTKVEVPETEVVETIAGDGTAVEQLDEVGTNERKLDKVSSEIMDIEANDFAEMKEEENFESDLPDTFFKKAYETMMLSDGDDDVMKGEMKRMIAQAQKDIKLAYKIAKDKFKQRKITDITKIKDGMRNINTDILTVVEVESMEYQKTKKQKAIAKRAIVADDEGNEGVLYLFDDRGEGLGPQMKIKIVKGYAKTFDFSGETALTISKKGNVYIVL